MTEEITIPNFCEVFEIDIRPNTELKGFGKLFCSEEYMDHLVKSRQKGLANEESVKSPEAERQKREGYGWRDLIKLLLGK